MTAKELRKLSRKDLLELLVEYGEELEETKGKLVVAEKKVADQQMVIDNNDDLAEKLEDCRMEADDLREQLKEAEKKLEKKELNISEAGSIAVASLRVNDIFTRAQEAADQYLENIKNRNLEIDRMCELRETESRMKAERMIKEAELRCAAMEAQAKAESDRCWREASAKLQGMIDSHSYLKKMLAMMDLG